MSAALEARIAQRLAKDVAPSVRAFAERLARAVDGSAVLFYGSNLRTAALDGVLDFYVLVPGTPERGIWPRVSYHEWVHGGRELRAKVATMTVAKFAQAASGALLDTTIWTRFVQPSALVWQRDEEAAQAAIQAIAAASATAARLAAVLGPPRATERAYWSALFQATYKAEFRIEKVSRAQGILDLNPGQFEGLLPLGLDRAGIAYAVEGDTIAPHIAPRERVRVKRWWARRRIMSKAINLLRLVRAASTFDGAARYAAWKIERHSGVAVRLTPWRERHPVLAAPAVLFSVWRQRRRDRAT